MKLYGIGDYDVEKLFLWLLEVEKRRGAFSGFSGKTKLLFLLGGSLLIKKRTYNYYHKSTTPSILFLISEVNLRTDLMDMMKQVCTTVPARSFDFLILTKNISFSFKRFFLNLAKLMVWAFQLRGKYHSITQLMLIQKCLLEASDYQKEIINYINIHKINLTVVRYDAQFLDNFMLQTMCKYGIKTATLQHGVMISERPQLSYKADFCGFEFKASVADYFLVWNEFEKQEALKSGISERKIIITGNAKCIKVKPLENLTDNVKFGVLLDGFDMYDNNKKLIEMANQISTLLGLSYVVRYHPAFRGNEYSSIISSNLGTVSKISDIRDFLSELRFCLISNSTILFELPYYHIPYYRFSEQRQDDKYLNLSEPSFCDIESFYILYKSTKSPEFQSSDLFNNYKNFFAGFINC